MRAVFVVDPQNTIRAMISYPLTNGRSIDEVLRLVDSLQTSSANACATPANWKPGEKVIVPPPKTEAEVEQRLSSSYEKVDFYLMKRSL